MNFTMHTIY